MWGLLKCLSCSSSCLQQESLLSSHSVLILAAPLNTTLRTEDTTWIEVDARRRNQSPQFHPLTKDSYDLWNHLGTVHRGQSQGSMDMIASWITLLAGLSCSKNKAEPCLETRSAPFPLSQQFKNNFYLLTNDSIFNILFSQMNIKRQFLHLCNFSQFSKPVFQQTSMP